ncbi:MAG: hypothetical protein DDT31_00238 [Syntrophomonadaceae bacterium]|nr:hypothetical protein [Bacillota bacterium]
MKVQIIKKSIKNLQHYIEKGHVRYMPESVRLQLAALVPNCSGSAAELMFWVKHQLTDYPKCAACNTKLSSFHWEPFLKTSLRTPTGEKKGYRPYCSRECAYMYGTKKESYRQTCMAKYGVDHPMKTEEVVAKLKAANIDRYGHATPNRWTGEKFLSTIESKHDPRVVRHITGVSDKIAATKALQTLELLPRKVKEIESLFEVECLTDTSNINLQRIGDADLEWKHTCGRVWMSSISFRGIRGCPTCSRGTSKGEAAVAEFVQSLGIGVESRSRKIIPPRELDIWIPEKKLAIEFDGTYWHSAKFEGRKKCREKLELCEARSIHLITLQEHLWINHSEMVKARLSSILGFTVRLPGRNTVAKIISTAESKPFLQSNHLQGNARSNVQVGLYHNDELVAVATFGRPRWAHGQDWELIRMASLPRVTVQGGASKLIKFFRTHHAGSLISYADRCWSTGNVYRQIGFTFSHHTPPSYCWVHHSLGTYARYQTQKAKLKKLLDGLKKEFYPELSEEDNMRMAGFLPLYDRGNSVWLLA